MIKINAYLFSKFFLLVVSLFLLSSCATYQHNISIHKIEANNLNDGSTIAADYLFERIRTHHQNESNVFERLTHFNQPLKIVIDPFVDWHSSEEVVASTQITKAMMQQAQQHRKLDLKPLSQDTLAGVNYVIRGYLYYDQAQNKYHLLSMAVFIPSVEIIATSDILINENQLDYQRTAEYQDMPIFPVIKGDKVISAAIKPGTKIKLDFSTQAILNDAAKAYANKNFVLAKQLYKLASKRSNGQTSRTYSGLYISLLRLGKQDEAEKAFDRLVELNLAKNNALALKLLFKVDSVAFAGDAFSQQQYAIWVRKIAKLIEQKRSCLTVAGHSSRSGSAAYNVQLSQQRSLAVIDKMASHFSDVKRYTKAVGKGFSENLVGSGTDDARDLLDRRVEFLKGC